MQTRPLPQSTRYFVITPTTAQAKVVLTDIIDAVTALDPHARMIAKTTYSGTLSSRRSS